MHITTNWKPDHYGIQSSIDIAATEQKGFLRERSCSDLLFFHSQFRLFVFAC